MGEEVDQESESEGTQEKLDDPYHQGQGNGQGDIGVAAGFGQGCHPSRCQQGDHGNRSDSQLSGCAEQGIEDQGNGRGIQAVHRRKAGDHGIGHALGDQHDTNC